jgi:hypothetical protein
MTPWLPKRLSVTAVEAYIRCPAAYERRYVHGVIDPPSPPMSFGRCMATALEALHRGQDGEVAWLRAYAAAQAAGEMAGAPSIQHGLHWAYTRLMGHKPQQVRFIVLHTRRVELREFVTYPSGEGLRLFELQAAAVWRGVRDGKFPATCRKPYCAACVEAGVVPAKTPRAGLELSV